MIIRTEKRNKCVAVESLGDRQEEGIKSLYGLTGAGGAQEAVVCSGTGEATTR